MTLYDRIAASLHNSEPPALEPADHFPPDDIAAMLREIGVALIEASQ